MDKRDYLIGSYAKGKKSFANEGLDDADVSNADLRGINLSGASMNQFFADGANLSRADLSNVRAYQAGFTETDLSEAY